MSVVGRIFIHDIKSRCQVYAKYTLGKDLSSVSATPVASDKSFTHENNIDPTKQRLNRKKNAEYPSEYRFIYPEFLPSPQFPKSRNAVREKLERIDMLARRSVIEIPEFYVGSILAITHSDRHATGKTSRFVGICIAKRGAGIIHNILLRNVVDGQPVEMDYDIYDPCIQKIECLRLEKRLDKHLLYLRDAPLIYSTFPFDMDQEFIFDRKEVPVNPLKVPLLPQPWVAKYELQNLKGVAEETIIINQNRTRKAAKAAKPWEKYDLMKIYRNTISEEEQDEVFSEIHSKLHEMESVLQKKKNARVFVRPKKTG